MNTPTPGPHPTARSIVLALFILSFCASASAAEQPITKQEYLSYMTTAAENGWRDLRAGQERWRKSIDPTYIFGYNPLWEDVYLAALSANLYEVTREEKYLDRAKALLLYYGRYRDAYPAGYAKSRPDIFCPGW